MYSYHILYPARSSAGVRWGAWELIMLKTWLIWKLETEIKLQSVFLHFCQSLSEPQAAIPVQFQKLLDEDFYLSQPNLVMYQG